MHACNNVHYTFYFSSYVDAITQQLEIYAADDTEEKSKPISFSCKDNLTTEAVLRIFRKATTKYKEEFSEAPPVLPIEGQIFLYSLGKDKTLWQKKKMKLRSVCFILVIINKIVDVTSTDGCN